MKIIYEEGPDTITMGQYQFQKGKPQDIPDTVAKALLIKKSIRFSEVKETSTKNRKEEK